MKSDKGDLRKQKDDIIKDTQKTLDNRKSLKIHIGKLRQNIGIIDDQVDNGIAYLKKAKNGFIKMPDAAFYTYPPH